MALKKAADFLFNIGYEESMTENGDGHDTSNDPLKKHADNSNVIPLKVPRKKAPNKQQPAPPPPPLQQKRPQASSEPLINMPPYTKYLMGVIIAIHLVVAFILNDKQAYELYIHFGFIPGRFTGSALFEPLALLTPFSHIFLHGSWLHIAMNAVMLLAFGSGVERWIGGKKMIAFFILCSLFGIAAHFALNYNSITPVIGASGGLSGLFAAALIMINRRNSGMTGKYGMWPFILLWIGISVIFGFLGSPDGGQIAWAAHVGGFLGGFAVLKLMKV